MTTDGRYPLEHQGGNHFVWVLVDLSCSRIEYWDSFHNDNKTVVVRRLSAPLPSWSF